MEENGSELTKKEEEDKEERWRRWRNSQEEAGRPLQPLPQPRLRSGVCRAGRITHSDATAVVLLHAAQEQQAAQNAAVRLLHPRL